MRENERRLLDRATEINASPANTRRREELISEAMETGYTRDHANLIYDVASETRLDPALAFALVISGIGVRDLAGNGPDNGQETQVAAPPAWVNAEEPRSHDADRELRLRMTFRRLQSRIDAAESADAALHAFLREPDVGDVAY